MNGSDTFACLLAGLSLYGAGSLAHDLYRAARSTARAGKRSAEWTAAKWRAYALARDRKRDHRRDGLARDLAEAVANLSRQRAEYPPEGGLPPEIPTAVATTSVGASSVPQGPEKLAEVAQAPAPATPTFPDRSPLARYKRCVRYAAFQGREKWTELAPLLESEGHTKEAMDCRIRADWKAGPFEGRSVNAPRAS